MFKNAKPFIPKFDNETYKLRIGKQVPPNGVNLSYYYCPPLTPSENVIIGDNSGFIIENAQQQQYELMYGTKEYILENADSENEIDTELIEMTDKFYIDTPLYYVHKLSKLFYGDRDDMTGAYYGQSVKVVDVYGNKLPNSMCYKIILEKPTVTTKELRRENMYEVSIYTSFQIENNFRVKAVYNSVEKNAYDRYVMVSDDEEIINPQIFFKKANTVIGAISSPNRYYIEKSPSKIKSSVLYTNGTFLDPRTPQKIAIDVVVTYSGGSTQKLRFPAAGTIDLYNVESAINSELSSFKKDRQVISEVINTLTTGSDIVSVKATVAECDREKEKISLYVRPDGKGKLYVKTTCDTGVVSQVPDKHFKKIGEHIAIGYGIKFKDRNPIKLLTPRETDSLDVWNIRVQNGRFKKTIDGVEYHYYIPEYFNQIYDQKYGYPYKKVIKEAPTVISKNAIKVKNAPLFIDKVDGKFKNINVYRLDELNNRWPMFIESWNDLDGIITLVDMISENDNIMVDYMYDEQSHIYKGYTHYDDYDVPSYVQIDCNPNQHHRSREVLGVSTADVTTFRFINDVVYFYIKPAIVIDGINKTFNNNVIQHSIGKLDATVIADNKLELIGVVYIRPNSSFYSLELVDTRTRGGGIINEMSNSLRKELEPESDYYWDIGYWDGEPYSENSVVIVRLDKKLLKEHGGRFTKDEIDAAVKKHMAFGTIPIIEFVTTYAADEMKIRNLEITKE